MQLYFGWLAGFDVLGSNPQDVKHNKQLTDFTLYKKTLIKTCQVVKK